MVPLKPPLFFHFTLPLSRYFPINVNVFIQYVFLITGWDMWSILKPQNQSRSLFTPGTIHFCPYIWVLSHDSVPLTYCICRQSGGKKCRISIHILQAPQEIVLKYVITCGFFVLLLADFPIAAVWQLLLQYMDYSQSA